MEEKKRKIKCKSENLAGFKLPCYVLEDGTRVLSGRGMQEALKMVDEVEKGKETPGSRLDRYLNQPSLKPFIYKGKKLDHYDPIICYDGEKKIHGYEASRLVDICDAFLEARRQVREKERHLSPRQEIIAKQCEILSRAFMKVGIIALIDEATGYQKVRDEFELQKMLKAYISEETLEWQKTFHNSFYEQLYRLWKPDTPERKNKNNPWFFGTLTNEFVYKKLPDGVLEALKKKTPKSKRLHQSLTPEIGREHLKKQIHSVEALARVSKGKNEFLELIERYHPSKDLKQKTYEVDFDQVLKNAINTPPLKLKDLKEKLKRTGEKRKILNKF